MCPAVPLPLASIAAAASAHFLAGARLFDRWILIAIAVLIAAAVANYAIPVMAVTSVT